ncbi:MAG: TlpA family protein disulfide reductase [Elusimicrobiota bacterium]|nr:TlpA family protein disulfide reductase [Elusimicrobiota bacterium]
MKKSLIAAFFAAFFVIYNFHTAQAVSEKTMADLLQAGLMTTKDKVAAIDFSLPSLEGKTIVLSSLKGKIVLLNFWTSWCPPCRAEIPSMQVLFERFKNEGLEFAAVNIQENNKIVAKIKQQFGITFPLLLDISGQVGAKYGISAIPTTFIIDRDGNIIARAVGGIKWDSPQMIEAFKKLLSDR